MKITIVKNSVLIILLLLSTVTVNAQKTYLKITNSDIGDNVIMYPPGTEFELKTKEGYIVFKNSGNEGFIEITEKHTLYVYPSWKDSADVFVLIDGKVEKVLTTSYRDSHDDNDTDEKKNNGVTASSKVTDSKTLKGKKNLEFTLSNGITFNYNDGLFSATLGDKNLTIKHRYIVYSNLGTLKLSFNPNNGVVWWVFDDNQKQSDLVGTWKIDLRPTPESEAYYQTLNISKIDGKTLEGIFYGSTIASGFINTEWDKVYFSFTTSDASNDYYHSGYILDGKLYGISYCPNRKLTAPWTGTQEEE